MFTGPWIFLEILYVFSRSDNTSQGKVHDCNGRQEDEE